MRVDVERARVVDPATRALEDLRFIRSTMERSEGFTAVSGLALIAIGGIALCAAAVSAFVAHAAPGSDAWITVWGAAGAFALVLGALALVRKARRHGIAIARGLDRKLGLCLGGPLVAGLVLTVALVRVDARALLPGAWLALYGAGVVAAGAFSTRSIPWLGTACMALGAASLLGAPVPPDVVLALGFGVLHVVVGARIARRHGG